MIMKAIQKFKSERDTLITYTNLKNIPENVIIEIAPERPGSIQTEKISDREDGLSFRVDMKKGEKWNVHHHDCDEVILMYKGSLRGLLTGMIAKPNQFIELPALTSHEIIAEEDSTFYVEFKNPLYIKTYV